MRKIYVYAVVVSLFITGIAYAQSADAVLDLLLKKGLITTQDVQDVKSKLDAQMVQTVEKYDKVKFPKWIQEMVFSSDLRLRAEDFSYEPSLAQSDRTRYRLRLRLGVETKFTDWAMAGVRVGTGDGDPVSQNQTLTDTFRKKPVSIDLAYIALRLPESDLLKVTAGKMNVPIWQPNVLMPVVYSSCVTPEGLAEQFNWRFGSQEQFRLFANFGQYSVKEFSSDANDVYMFDLQGGLEAKCGDGKKPWLRFTTAGGYYLTYNLGNAAYAMGDSPNSFGNATRLVVVNNKTNTVAYADFNVVNVRGEVAWQVSEKTFLATPSVLTFAGEYFVNITPSYDDVIGSNSGGTNSQNQTTAWDVGIIFGSAQKKGQWQVGYEYRYVQADATWDAIVESDFGTGGTDRKGHVVRAQYNLQDWWQVAFTSTITEKISDRPNTGHNNNGIAGESLLRLQLDTTVKF